jgi:hypothetical protein
MISVHAPVRPLGPEHTAASPNRGVAPKLVSPRSTGRAIPFRTIASRGRKATMSTLRALASYGSPPFFEFERRGPARTNLGAGVSRASDSFWPLSPW